jgi:CubicO group peptidase (beta-lactamase class C family)
MDPLSEAQSDRVDGLFAHSSRSGVPGLAVGVYRNGRSVLLRGYGEGVLEYCIPITPRTVFHAASVSKQFTAFAVALLARERRLDLNDDIRRFLPFVPSFGQRITIRNLIHHTSGLRDQWALFGLGGQEIDNRLRQQQILNMVSRQRALNFEPGSDFTYSNTGYTLLAEIVRAVTGQTLRQFSGERIFHPLGMAHTFFRDDITEVVPNAAQSYVKDADTRWRRALLNYDNAGATSLVTTVEDLLKWAANFAHPTVGDRELIAEIMAPGALRDGTPINYGFGLMRDWYAGHEAVLHFGADAGFRAVFAYFPASDFAVAMLANHPVEDWARLINGLVDTYLNGSTGALKDDTPAATTMDPVRLCELAGHYINEFDPLVVLEEQGGQLWWRTAGGAPKPVFYRADGTFDLGNGPRNGCYYRAQRDGTGRVIGFEDVSRKLPAAGARVRIEPVSPAPGDLAELAGSYRSPELDITYVLTVENGALVARSLWTPHPVTFTPCLRDRFDAEPHWMSTIRFVRDVHGRVTGLRVHGGRIRNVWFAKVEES